MKGLEMVKCESLRINMFRITHTGKSENFPVTTARIASKFIFLSAVHIYNFHILTVIYLSLHGFIWNQQNNRSVGRALHRYRRGHGLKSRAGLNFFFFFSGLTFTKLLKSCSLLQGSLPYSL